MADWINAQVPHWLEARVQQRDPTQAVMAAMQFGANQRQHNFENGLRLRQLDMQDQAQQLQNRSTGLRIEQMQRDLENESHDIGLMEGYLSSINGVTDIDQLREVGAKIPAFKNPLNVSRAIGAASTRLNMLSGTLAQKQAADDRAYFTKEMDALDPDLRALARTTLGDSGMPEDADAIATLKYVRDEQQQRNLEKKTEEWRATHTTGLMQEFPAFNPDGTLDTQHIWVPNTTGTGYILRTKIKPEPEIPSRMTVADAQDIKILDEKRKEIVAAIPESVPREKALFSSALTDEFKDYQSKTNELAQIDAKREAILQKYRPKASTEKRISNQAEYDALPSGTVYIGEDGRKYRKP